MTAHFFTSCLPNVAPESPKDERKRRNNGEEPSLGLSISKRGLKSPKGLLTKTCGIFPRPNTIEPKKSYEQMKRQHRKSGSRKSLEQWARDTGRAKRSGCCIM